MNKIIEIAKATKPIPLNSSNVMKTFEEYPKWLKISTAAIPIPK